MLLYKQLSRRGEREQISFFKRQMDTTKLLQSEIRRIQLKTFKLLHITRERNHKREQVRERADLRCVKNEYVTK